MLAHFTSDEGRKQLSAAAAPGKKVFNPLLGMVPPDLAISDEFPNDLLGPLSRELRDRDTGTEIPLKSVLRFHEMRLYP
ncbi:MAG: hypothetical protein ACYCSF_03455 [Acidimicrobiales bacterium]